MVWRPLSGEIRAAPMRATDEKKRSEKSVPGMILSLKIFTGLTVLRSLHVKSIANGPNLLTCCGLKLVPQRELDPISHLGFDELDPLSSALQLPRANSTYGNIDQVSVKNKKVEYFEKKGTNTAFLYIPVSAWTVRFQRYAVCILGASTA